jgi:trehalose 6-phosphate phosphatase
MREIPAGQASMPETDGTYALFLDFDGTLVDIVERPDAVVVDPGLPEILTRLERRLGGALAIISGRPVEFLDGRFVPHEFDMAGLHGLEHRIAGQLSMCDPADHRAQGGMVAIHWRLAPHEKEFALATAQAAVEALGSDYRVQHGKAVAEILPSAAGKGKVIERFLHETPYKGRCPIFVGDDLTDENGFKIVNAHGGLSVRIGAGETIAKVRLGTPAELRHCLSTWAFEGSLPFKGDDC